MISLLNIIHENRMKVGGYSKHTRDHLLVFLVSGWALKGLGDTHEMSLSWYLRVAKIEKHKQSFKSPINGSRRLFLIRETTSLNVIHQKCLWVFILFVSCTFHLIYHVVSHTVNEEIDLILFEVLHCLTYAGTSRAFNRMIHFNKMRNIWIKFIFSVVQVLLTSSLLPKLFL